jgi:enediyne biosynthesis protein CalE5
VLRAQQRANWNAISVGWESWQDWFESAAFAVTERLVQLAGLRPGQRVLDVGSGIGEPALTAARVVGPSGRVVGVDLAPDMVARARRRADGTGNVQFIEGDVETLDLPGTAFDAVLSRWGLCPGAQATLDLSAAARDAGSIQHVTPRRRLVR